MGQSKFSYKLTFWFISIENRGKQKSKNALRVEINQFCDGKCDTMRRSKTTKHRTVEDLPLNILSFLLILLFYYLADILNYILRTGYVPKQLNEGVLTPVLKKGKDSSLPTNYRGITVLSILGKLLEKVILKRTDSTFSPNQSPLQRGFKKKPSSINAALLVSEAQNEAADL